MGIMKSDLLLLLRLLPFIIIIVSFFLLIRLPYVRPKQLITSLSKGTSLSVEDYSSVVLVSPAPDMTFSCGFYEVAPNAFVFSVWFTNSADRTVVWTANRDNPVNGRRSRLTLREQGSLELWDANGTVIWSSKTRSDAVGQLELLSSGNLVLKEEGGGDAAVVWQSFDSPTDTLLPTQPMTKNTPLRSSAARGMLSTGIYRFYFDTDNVLRLIYEGAEASSIYWPDPFNKVWDNHRTSYNSSRYAILDDLGQFTSSDELQFLASDFGHGIPRRLALDYDGNLRLYSLIQSSGHWAVSWQALQQPLDIHGTCGQNGLAVMIFSPSSTSMVAQTSVVVKCSCPPGFQANDPSDWSMGCKRKPSFIFSCDHPADRVQFKRLADTDFWGFDFNYTSGLSYDQCKQMCVEMCECQAFGYRKGSGECYPKTSLFNGRTSSSTNNDIYMKYPQGLNLSNLASSPAREPICNASAAVREGQIYGMNTAGGSTKWHYLIWFISTLGVIEVIFIAIGFCFIQIRKDKNPAVLVEEGYRALKNHFQRFKYSELKRATRDFKDVIGRGGSGVVYKGVLDDERIVAVKKLEDVDQGEEEFQAELSIIGRIYHKNLVKMLGYCADRKCKLLVSEFVMNGSLDKALAMNADGLVLGWGERFRIAVGVAQGLAYLHHECLEWVIHCDIKPENILLDHDFEPKIADFGLAKLLNRGVGRPTSSNLSRVRGTRGYIAPEWASSLPITGKVDVYSYGIVLLELLKGDRVSNWVVNGGGGEQVEMVPRSTVMVMRERIMEIKGSEEEESWISDFVDHRLNGRFSLKQANVMMNIALFCLEEDRNKRPSMDYILHLLLSTHDHELHDDDLLLNIT